MGDNLKVIDWGTGFVVDQISGSGYKHTCAISTERVLKCIGSGVYGELGSGSYVANRGNTAGSMGDAIPAVDLGADFESVQVSASAYFTCVVSSSGGLKCFGRGMFGNLGLEDGGNYGGSASTIGDNLPFVNLGADFTVSSVQCGSRHACALSTGGQLKCFGDNGNGQLGYGDTTARGKTTGTMGDALAVIDLGTGFEIKDFSVGVYHNCVLSTGGEIKCFGQNYPNGQLGIGSYHTQGDAAGEMGDNLEAADIGAGFSASKMGISSSYSYHSCVFEEASDLLLKCWGKNYDGQLGYGDTSNRGDSSGEMGEQLLFISTGFSPTGSALQCNASAMHSVNWNDLLNAGGDDDALLHDYAVEFDPATLSLTVSVSAEYVGNSSDGNFNDNANLGTTYYIDFQSFSELDGGVESAGSCANRRSSDYADLEFAHFWKYPANPMDLESAANADRMAYPPSDWNLTANGCGEVVYERTFSWTDLTACEDAAGSATIAVQQTDSSIVLSGTLFVELVSPYSMSSAGYYRTFPVLQQDFGITLSRTVNVLASTGVQLFIPSVMAYGRDEDGNYTVTILVQSADYVMLGDDDAVSVIGSPLAVSGVDTVTTECLVATSFTCGQIFTATIPAECSNGASTVDLSGKYEFGFTPKCREEDGVSTAACDVFLTTLEDSAGKVVLDVDAAYLDPCDVDLFNVTVGGELKFYSDSAFTAEAEVDGSDPFVIGQDTIYGKVTVDIPSDPSGAMYQFVDVAIENVYVCTADAALSVDPDSGLGGCLSSAIDADGPYNVIGEGAVPEYEGTTYDLAGNNVEGFSFLTFDTPRETINVHVQLLMTLVTESGEQRRRMLLQMGDDAIAGNAFRSYIETVEVQREESTASDPVGSDATAPFTAGFMPAMLVLTGWIMG